MLPKENADALGMSLGQLLGYEQAPMCEMARKYVKGQPLVIPVEETQLSTNMWILHNWYMTVTKKYSKEWFSADVRKEHHFKDYLIYIQMNELFRLYNQRALNKSILGCYGL